jgi:uncharacterized protein
VNVGQPVVHFEIIGNDPPRLRRYYGDLFGWEFDTSGPVSPAVSQPGHDGYAVTRANARGLTIRRAIA